MSFPNKTPDEWIDRLAKLPLHERETVVGIIHLFREEGTATDTAVERMLRRLGL